MICCGVGDDMVIGDDQPGRIDDEPRAERGDARSGRARCGFFAEEFAEHLVERRARANSAAPPAPGGAARAAAWVETLTTTADQPPRQAARKDRRRASRRPRRRPGVGRSRRAAAPGGGAAAVPGSGGVRGARRGRRFPVTARRLARAGTALDCASAGAAMMANSAQRSRDRSASSAEGLQDILLFAGSPEFIRCGGRTSRSERSAPRALSRLAIRRSGGRSGSGRWSFRSRSI